MTTDGITEEFLFGLKAFQRGGFLKRGRRKRLEGRGGQQPRLGAGGLVLATPADLGFPKQPGAGQAEGIAGSRADQGFQFIGCRGDAFTEIALPLNYGHHTAEAEPGLKDLP